MQFRWFLSCPALCGSNGWRAVWLCACQQQRLWNKGSEGDSKAQDQQESSSSQGECLGSLLEEAEAPLLCVLVDKTISQGEKCSWTQCSAHLYCNLFISATQTEDNVIQMLISSWQHYRASLSKKQSSSADEAEAHGVHCTLPVQVPNSGTVTAPIQHLHRELRSSRPGFQGSAVSLLYWTELPEQHGNWVRLL